MLKLWLLRRHTYYSNCAIIHNVKRIKPRDQKAVAAGTATARKEASAVQESGYTPYGYVGEVNGQMIEVVSPEELQELIEDDDE